MRKLGANGIDRTTFASLTMMYQFQRRALIF